VEKLATGWIYLGSEAVKLGLIDATGTYRDAVDEAAGLSGITRKPVVASHQ
jgi:ClpP class serine protease